MSEPIYEALVARRRGDPTASVPATPADREDFKSLISELDACAFYADGTRRGELVPLADTTRHRMAKALREAIAALLARNADSGLLSPGVFRLAAERERSIRRGEYDINNSRRELMAAAECFLLVAQSGADGWHNPDGSYAPPGGWPWAESAWRPSPEREENLATAGAYIAAALDRAAID
ncbi:hypothetical protein ACFVU2_19585 [Leifsonia sp. NPDC058194]|uniref:hypothetical protein n=1 Tax=Leifsonia sp. NPDC058194 TaxID=3346374 RepID=UPI0036DE66E6